MATIREEYAGRIPLESYIHCFRHHAGNALTGDDKELLIQGIEMIFKELSADYDIEPLQQIELAAIIGSFMQERLTKEWLPPDNEEESPLCDLYHEVYIPKCSNLLIKTLNAEQ